VRRRGPRGARSPRTGRPSATATGIGTGRPAPGASSCGSPSCGRADGKVKAFLDRPIEGDWRYLWVDATYLKVRRGGCIVSVAVIVAVGVNADGRREVLGLDVGTSEAEPIWTECLRTLTRRGLRGVKLVISDAHEGSRPR